MPLDEEKPKKLDHEVRNMVSAIMGPISNLQRLGLSQTFEEDDGSGVGIVTLAGSNVGATLKSEMDEKSSDPDEELDSMSTYVNSNFQAMNNSIVMGGSYTTNDPGVHLDVSDFVDQHGKDHRMAEKLSKKEKKKKGEESGNSDQQTEHSE